MSYNFQQPFLTLGNGLNTIQGGVVGGWKELGRHTAGGASTTMTVSSIPNKRYYMILYYDKGIAGAPARYINFNSDTGSNYARRQSIGGAADGTSVSQTILNAFAANNVWPQFAVQYYSNLSTKEKLLISQSNDQGTAGAANVPGRVEWVAKWANTTNAIDDITVTCSSNFPSGSEIVVLGWDPADTHTTNFWEELASVDLTGGAASTIDSGTFTAKKYLWWQFFTDEVSSNSRVDGTFNSDTTTYSSRVSENGVADVTSTSDAYFKISNGVYNSGVPIFANGFTINNSSNEKLSITNLTSSGSALGATNAPYRTEGVSKHDNTGSQITSIQINTSVGNWGTGTLLKVWGSN